MADSRRIVTINDKALYPMVGTPAEEVTISDIAKSKQIFSDMQQVLQQKLPGTATGTHSTPAYLAANQIEINKKMVLLYLPPSNAENARWLLMHNPTFIENANKGHGSPSEYRISTFFIEQLRIQNACYAQEISVTYYNENWNLKTICLTDQAAIAAQMGINFTNGITPLDFNINKEQLAAFIQNPDIVQSAVIITTRNAYRLQNRLVTQDSQFNTDQISFIQDFINWRQLHPCIELKADEDLNLRLNAV